MIEQKTSNKIYDLLIRVGASPNQRASFIHCQPVGCREYRFQGIFGFGGKFWDNNDRWYVTYYSEDRTEELDKRMKEVNIKLAELKERINNEN